jgi:nicotinamidase/pyrazinamidase
MRAFFDIDTQIDFVFPAGALYGKGAERVIEPVSSLNHYAAGHGIPLISSMCAHPENAKEFAVWPPHCVVGTVGQQKPAATLLPKRFVVPNTRGEFGLNAPQQIIVEKDDLDLFSNPNVPALLDGLRVDECVVYGVFTEYCVKCAVMGLLKSGRRVSLVTEATAHLENAAGEAIIRDFLAGGGRCAGMAEVQATAA